MMGMGGSELFIAVTGGILMWGVPVVCLVLLVMIYGKVRDIERRLGG